MIYENSGIEDFKLLRNKYDLVTLAFGFRNFTNHEKGLRNIYDCLEPVSYTHLTLPTILRV